MLQDILSKMVAIIKYRNELESTVSHGTIYGGWGTTVENAISNYYLDGGTFKIIRKLENLAYFKARIQ